MNRCRLCGSASQLWQTVAEQHYEYCECCGAIQLSAAQLPDAVREKACYDTHQNRVDDPAYRHFLSRLSEPLLECVTLPACGLDYGCGPGPALAAMLGEAGCTMAVYDPIYYPHPAVLQHRYDFITCSEVIEHFHNPAAEFARLLGLLKPGGILALMTSWYHAGIHFARWYYRRDPTHVCFYQQHTFAWLARRYGLHCTYPAPNICLLSAALKMSGQSKA